MHEFLFLKICNYFLLLFFKKKIIAIVQLYCLGLGLCQGAELHMLCYRGGDKQNIFQTELGELVHQDIHRQLGRLVSEVVFSCLSSLFESKGWDMVRQQLLWYQRYCKKKQNGQDILMGSMMVCQSCGFHNTEAHDRVSVRVVGSQVYSWSPFGFKGSHVSVARPTQICINSRKTRPNRTTSHTFMLQPNDLYLAW